MSLKGGETSYFVALHRNKRGVAIDLKHPRGKELFFALVVRCDVVLENYRVGALRKLGPDYEAARRRNPGIIYCSISGFGQDGPYRDRAALNLILQAESGMISVTGEKLWRKFCPVIGCPELAEDPRYRTSTDRMCNRDTLIPRLQEVFLTKTYAEWSDRKFNPALSPVRRACAPGAGADEVAGCA